MIFCDLCFERRIRRYAYAYTEEDIIRPGINRDGRFELSDASVGYSEAPKRARSHTFHEHAHTRTRKLRHLQTYKHIHSPDRPPPAGIGSQAPDLGLTEEVRCVRRCRPQERVRPRCVSGPGPSCAAARRDKCGPPVHSAPAWLSLRGARRPGCVSVERDAASCSYVVMPALRARCLQPGDIVRPGCGG